jgi:hypothetical protein
MNQHETNRPRRFNMALDVLFSDYNRSFTGKGAGLM